VDVKGRAQNSLIIVHARRIQRVIRTCEVLQKGTGSGMTYTPFFLPQLCKRIAMLLGVALLTFGLLSASGCRTSNGPKKSDIKREARVRDMAAYIRPGMTLGEVNKLIGWKASLRAGNWFWTPTGQLLVQTNLKSSNSTKVGTIIGVYDFYRKRVYQFGQPNNKFYEVSKGVFQIPMQALQNAGTQSNASDPIEDSLNRANRVDQDVRVKPIR